MLNRGKSLAALAACFIVSTSALAQTPAPKPELARVIAALEPGLPRRSGLYCLVVKPHIQSERFTSNPRSGTGVNTVASACPFYHRRGTVQA